MKRAKMDRVARLIGCLVFVTWICLWMLGVIPADSPSLVKAQEFGYLHSDGNRILDSNGNLVIVTGISWFGLETENFAPHGLWARSLESYMDQIVELGFNTIRVPFSNQLFAPDSKPNGINYDLNPDLAGLNGLEIMDRMIAEAGERDLKVILDRHRPDSHAQSELWYTSAVSEERWITDWVMLVERYAQDDTVIAVDLHNEPHGSATWGSGDEATDWRLAAERAGNAILAANSNLLIIVQGVEQFQGDFYWWGGNLMGAAEYPVRLSQPGRLIYSPHTYGPGVYPQPWFLDESFPDNMPEIWDRHWGFIHKTGLAPVMVGEFGGRSVLDDREGVWQRALVSYLKENGISYVYWSLNPNSGDTGGVLLDDWQTVDPNKLELLTSYQAPLIGSGLGPAASATQVDSSPTATSQASPIPPTVASTPPTTTSQEPPVGLRVRYHTSNPVGMSKDSKPEFIIANFGPSTVNLDELELVYWFTDELAQKHVFQCDWAQIGCENVVGEFEASADGEYALHVRFSPGSGTLPAGQESGEIKVRFNRMDWSEFNQADDYSFATPNAYQEWERVALYWRGELVWGQPPDWSEAPPSEVPSPLAPATSLPANPETPEVGVADSGRITLVVAVAVAALFGVVGFVIALVWLGGRSRNR